MPAFLLTKRAQRDIFEIWDYIADDSEQHADKFLVDLTQRFLMLSNNPRAGRKREDIRKGIRGFPFGEYEILYRIHGLQIQISDVLHGRRDLGRMRTRIR